MATKDPKEADVEEKFISPAIRKAGWKFDDYTKQKIITDGQIMTQGNIIHRGKKWIADYELFDRDNYAIAIIESKRYDAEAEEGLQQAIDYAMCEGASFAYSSNGKKFIERDLLTGKERDIPMDEFPTKEELQRRLREAKNYTPEQEAIISQPYHSDMNSFEPRYYQKLAINKTIEAVARGMKRMLLVMATGTGKTYTAFQIIWRLHKAGVIQKALFLTDRNSLVNQTMLDDFKPFGNKMTKVQGSKPGNKHVVYLSLYGQWVSYEESKPHPYLSFSPDFFDLIIVDECHRGSVRDDSEWKQILEYFSPAVQIGMTATPKETEGADNISYFCQENNGEALYTYSLRDGIRDGFLAPYRVTQSFINIDMSGYTAEPDESDLFGFPLNQTYFSRTDYGRTLTIADRRCVVAHRITEMIKQLDPTRMLKTIVFCADQEEAELLRKELVKCNVDMVKKYPDYVCRITSNQRHVETYLEHFTSVKTKSPVIATTSDLLTTGVNCKTCGLIVIDKEIKSMTTFKQMIGRGTRIYEKANKLCFDILDFRNVTQLFQDKNFDGTADSTKVYTKTPPKDPPTPPTGEPTKFHVQGQNVAISYETKMTLGSNGKLMNVESLIDYTAETIRDKFPTIDIFKGKWAEADKHQAIIDELGDNAALLDAVREKKPEFKDVDDFDLVCHLAFGQKPLTRREKVENVKKRDIFSKYGAECRRVLEAILEKYAETGIKEIENAQILELNPFDQIGRKPKIMKLFGGPKGYYAAIRETVSELCKEA